MSNNREYGYDKITFAHGTEREIMDNIDKLAPYELAIAHDNDKVVFKKDDGTIRSFGIGSNTEETFVKKNGDTMTGKLVVKAIDNQVTIRAGEENGASYILSQDVNGVGEWYIGKGSKANNDVNIRSYKTETTLSLKAGSIDSNKPVTKNGVEYIHGNREARKASLGTPSPSIGVLTSDLNNCVAGDFGLYQKSVTPNYPSEIPGQFAYIETKSSYSSDARFQVAYPYDGGTCSAVRVYNQNTKAWEPWSISYTTRFKPSPSDIGAVPLSDVQSGSSSGAYGKIPKIGNDGVIEIGKYIDFHEPGDTVDYSVRISSGPSKITVSGDLSIASVDMGKSLNHNNLGTNGFGTNIRIAGTGGISNSIGVGMGLHDNGNHYFWNNKTGTPNIYSLTVNRDSITANGNVVAYSDIKLKEKLEIIPNALDKISELNGYTYTRKDTGVRQTGVVAQEVQKVLPEAVTVTKAVEGAEDKTDTLGVAYGNMAGLFIEAIKELKAEVDSLKAQLESVKNG